MAGGWCAVDVVSPDTGVAVVEGDRGDAAGLSRTKSAPGAFVLSAESDHARAVPTRFGSHA